MGIGIINKKLGIHKRECSVTFLQNSLREQGFPTFFSYSALCLLGHTQQFLGASLNSVLEGCSRRCWGLNLGLTHTKHALILLNYLPSPALQFNKGPSENTQQKSLDYFVFPQNFQKSEHLYSVYPTTNLTTLRM